MSDMTGTTEQDICIPMAVYFSNGTNPEERNNSLDGTPDIGYTERNKGLQAFDNRLGPEER